MTDTEKYYDEEIAPLLREIAEKCKDNGLSMVCAVEFNRNEIARTALLQKDKGLEMVMISHCAKTAPNIDSFMIGLKKYCNENNVDTSASIYLTER